MKKSIKELTKKPSEAKANDRTVRPHPKHESKRPGLSCSHYYRYVTNLIKGTKSNYVTVIKWKRLNKPLLRKLQKTYALGDLIIYKLNSYFYIISTKAVSFRRLQKILKVAHSINYSDLNQLKFNIIPVDDMYDKKLKVVSKIKLVEELKCSEGNYHSHSAFHSEYLNKKYQNTIGWTVSEMKKRKYSPFNIREEKVIA
jgi:hypothetical protein